MRSNHFAHVTAFFCAFSRIALNVLNAATLVAIMATLTYCFEKKANILIPYPISCDLYVLLLQVRQDIQLGLSVLGTMFINASQLFVFLSPLQ
jgi:hypothetical protein